MSYSIPKVTIVILHFENPQIMNDCLNSCNHISYLNYDIIIVQNGVASALDIGTIRKLNHHVTELIHNPENVGYARGNNLGIKKALNQKADYILLLNDDTTVAPDFLNILVEEGEKSADVGILGSKIYYSKQPKKIWFAGAKFDPKTCRLSDLNSDDIHSEINEKPFYSDYITGCALLIKRKLVEKIGFLDERFFLYWEDVDWGLRAQYAGFCNLSVPSSHIWHKASVSSGGTASPLKAYHKTRSHLLLAKIHTPWTIGKLHKHFFRDIAWLLFKSQGSDRFKKAYAFIAAIRDYHLGRSDKGPNWLWLK